MLLFLPAPSATPRCFALSTRSFTPSRPFPCDRNTRIFFGFRKCCSFSFRRWLNPSKIDLLLFQAHVYDPYPYPVSNPENLTAAFPDERMLLHDVIVIIMRKSRNMDHSFNKHLHQFYKKSMNYNTGNKSVILFANLIVHELHLFQLDNLAFRLHGYPFPLAGMGGNLWEYPEEAFLLPLFQAAAYDPLKYPMHNEIRVTTDR